MNSMRERELMEKLHNSAMGLMGETGDTYIDCLAYAANEMIADINQALKRMQSAAEDAEADRKLEAENHEDGDTPEYTLMCHCPTCEATRGGF